MELFNCTFFLGNDEMLTFSIVEGKKRRRYNELSDFEWSVALNKFSTRNEVSFVALIPNDNSTCDSLSVIFFDFSLLEDYATYFFGFYLFEEDDNNDIILFFMLFLALGHIILFVMWALLGLDWCMLKLLLRRSEIVLIRKRTWNRLTRFIDHSFVVE